MRIDVVTPERQLFSSDASAVQIPGAEGDMTVMAEHVPLVTTLRPGVVSITGSEAAEFVVTGGFAEVSADGASILAERAFAKADVTRDVLDGLIAAAEENAANVEAIAKAGAQKTVNDFKSLITQLSL